MRLAVAVVDSGPLIATADRDDDNHRRSLEILERSELSLVVPSPVTSEAGFLIGRRLGPHAEARFVREIAEYEVEAPNESDWLRIAELIERYADLLLGTVDASVVAIAERLDASLLVTLDRRHFTVVRPRHREAFELLPAV